MDISIGKPYQAEWSQIDLCIDNIIIKLYRNELEELFKVIDEELHWEETREDLLEEIFNLKEE